MNDVSVVRNKNNTKGTIGVRVFSLTLLSFIALGLLSDIGYWLVGKWVSHLPKLFFYTAILLMGIHFLLKRKIVNDVFVKYMLFYCVFAIVWGGWHNPFNKATLAHLFPLVLPIIGLSYGYYIAKNNSYFFEYFHSKLIISGVVLTLTAVLYFYLNKIGLISYFGAGALVAYPIFYCFAKKKYGWVLVFLFAAILTGKRSVLIAVLVVLFLSFITSYNFFQLKKFCVFILISIFLFMIAAIYNYSNNNGFYLGSFNRYMTILDIFVNLDLEHIDFNKIDTITSGRLFDALAAYDAVSGDFLSLLFGRGVGATFSVMYSFSDTLHVTHYSHFTPFAYLFLGGIFLMIPVYFKLCSLLFFSIFSAKNFYTMLFMYYFIMGIIGGAIFFTDPFVWFVTGVVLYQVKSKTKKVEWIYY
jgi:hypothetical protein